MNTKDYTEMWVVIPSIWGSSSSPERRWVGPIRSDGRRRTVPNLKKDAPGMMVGALCCHEDEGAAWRYYRTRVEAEIEGLRRDIQELEVELKWTDEELQKLARVKEAT